MKQVAEAIIEPYLTGGVERIAVSGEDVEVPGRLATNVAMGLHELATNGAKYGAIERHRPYRLHPKVGANRVRLDTL